MIITKQVTTIVEFKWNDDLEEWEVISVTAPFEIGEYVTSEELNMYLELV